MMRSPAGVCLRRRADGSGGGAEVGQGFYAGQEAFDVLAFRAAGVAFGELGEPQDDELRDQVVEEGEALVDLAGGVVAEGLELAAHAGGGAAQGELELGQA